jgi:hypothetical protein
VILFGNMSVPNIDVPGLSEADTIQITGNITINEIMPNKKYIIIVMKISIKE